MRAALLAPLALAGCGSFDPYAEGGAWLTPALDAGFQEACGPPDPRAAGPDIGDLARDFHLHDQFAYRVNLSDFCEHVVLLTVAEIGDPAAEALVAELPTIADDRLPTAERSAPFLALTTWFATPDGAVPTVADVRAYAEALGIDPTTGELSGQKVAVLRDEPRFAGAAAAASVQWAATNVPGELRSRTRVEREVAGRWTLRTTPFYVVVHPGGAIATCGDDLDADQIVQAIQDPPQLFVLEPGADGGPVTDCGTRSGP
jgi:hypothetical protein